MFFLLLDGLKTGQLRHTCENASCMVRWVKKTVQCFLAWWIAKKTGGYSFFLFWMDSMLLNPDVPVEMPIGWLEHVIRMFSWKFQGCSQCVSKMLKKFMMHGIHHSYTSTRRACSLMKTMIFGECAEVTIEMRV